MPNYSGISDFRIELVLGNLAVSGKQTLWTVPTGLPFGVKANITRIYLRELTGTVTGGNKICFGNNANADNWAGLIAITPLNGGLKGMTVFPDAGYPIMLGGEVFGFRMQNPTGAAATMRIAVIGVVVPVSE